MTNSEIINKITAEFRNRLIKKAKEADFYYGQSSKSDTIEGEIIAYADMLSFVSGLKENDNWKPSDLEKQEQKSISQEDFDRAKHEALWGEQKPNYCHYGGDPNVERCKYCSAACSARLTEEQKPAEWSEEDEEIFNNIIEKAKGGHWIEVNEITWLINHFKSLSPQPSWKPSKEEMEALDVACSGKLWYGEIYLEGLKRIREQLKKL